MENRLAIFPARELEARRRPKKREGVRVKKKRRNEIGSWLWRGRCISRRRDQLRECDSLYQRIVQVSRTRRAQHHSYRRPLRAHPRTLSRRAVAGADLGDRHETNHLSQYPVSIPLCRRKWGQKLNVPWQKVLQIACSQVIEIGIVWGLH